jgi:ABC-2 type transport system permease protein
MNSQMFGALLRKDFILYFSNRFFAFITVLALVFYTVVYFFMPAEIEETLEMALFAPNLPVEFLNQMEEGGVILARMDSVAALQTAVAAGEYEVGIALSDTFAQNLAAGGHETAHVYFNANFPEEFKDLYLTFLQEMGFLFSGQPLNLLVREEILGVDRAGSQIPYRDRMLPLFAVFILMMEMLGLASLISSEVSSGTLSALLVTPLRLEGLFLAKGTFGVGLAFAQVVVLMAITGGLSQQPILILLTLLLGALLVTGLGFLIASVATDLMSVMGWGMLGILLMALPAFAVLLPGLTSEWVKVIPSYYLVNTVYQVSNHGWGWGDAGPDLLALLLFACFFLALGVVVLRRKFR